MKDQQHFAMPIEKQFFLKTSPFRLELIDHEYQDFIITIILIRLNLNLVKSVSLLNEYAENAIISRDRLKDC